MALSPADGRASGFELKIKLCRFPQRVCLPLIFALAQLGIFQKFLIVETQVVLVAQGSESILHDIEQGFRPLKPIDKHGNHDER